MQWGAVCVPRVYSIPHGGGKSKTVRSTPSALTCRNDERIVAIAAPMPEQAVALGRSLVDTTVRQHPRRELHAHLVTRFSEGPVRPAPGLLPYDRSTEVRCCLDGDLFPGQHRLPRAEGAGPGKLS